LHTCSLLRIRRSSPVRRMQPIVRTKIRLTATGIGISLRAQPELIRWQGPIARQPRHKS
jgi:hypothetical protein